MHNKIIKLVLLVACVASSWAAEDNINSESGSSDLQTSATSAKLLNLGGLFGGVGGGGGTYYPTNNRPNYYPTSGYYPSSGFYPSSGSYPSSGYPTSGYPNSGYPTTGYPNSGYPSSGYYPTSGSYPSGTYPNSGYYPTSGSYPTSGNYPNTGGYYPTSTYYPATGTNILGGAGNGGYGGYGGNGGLRQYNGYLNSNYVGHRNLGYGYYKNTDRYGLPKTHKDRYGSRREQDRVSPSYRAYD